VKLSVEAITIIEGSQDQKKLKQVIALVEERLGEYAIVPTELQWTILINHLNEMLKRSREGETIPTVDRELFKEVSKEAIAISDEVVRTIGNLSEDEMYVLSIHFETAKNN
jgi:PRD domain protein (TIGR03582 family)